MTLLPLPSSLYRLTSDGRASYQHLTRRVLQHILRRRSHLELPQGPLIAHAQDYPVHRPLDRLVDDGVAGVPRLQDLRRYLKVEGIGHLLRPSQDSLSLPRLGAHTAPP